MEIFPDHAVYNGKVITLYEAACILARAMQRMYAKYSVPDGYTHYDLAMALKYNVVDAWVNGEEPEEY